MLGKLLKSLGIAALITLALEISYRVPWGWAVVVERIRYPELGLLALGILLVWAFVIFFEALTKRLWLSASIVSTLALVMSVANILKLEIRREPLYITDATYLSELGFLIDNIGKKATVAIIAGIIAIPLIMWGIHRLVQSRRRAESVSPNLAGGSSNGVTTPESLNGQDTDRGERRRRDRRSVETTTVRKDRIQRAIAATAALAVIVVAGTFNRPGNPAPAIWEAFGADWVPWDQEANYYVNGMVAGLLYTLPAVPMNEPEGYSEDAMADLVTRWQQRADELNAGRDTNALSDVNVVVVISETLTDPMVFHDLQTEDPIPYIRALMQTNPSGSLYVSGIGGGTAPVEFEVLSGMAMSNFRPQIIGAFERVVGPSETFPSFIRSFIDDGHEAISLHPYRASFYGRNSAYLAMGIENMRFDDALQHLTSLEGQNYASDASLFDEAIRVMQETEDPVFLNIVTMQNHRPYSGYPEPWPVQGLSDETELTSAQQYLRGLFYTDQATQSFAENLNALPEPTVVLMYGDHLPDIWSEGTLESAGDIANYETPWVIFANFPLPNTDSGIIGPNVLMNELLDATNTSYTPWAALLHDLAAEIPAMERTGWISPEGEEFTEEDISDRGREILADYRMVQYDVVSGGGWSIEAMYGNP